MSNKTSDKNVANVEDDIENVKKYIELVIDKDYCNCNELNVICGQHCDGSKNVAYSMQNILAEREQDKKRIQELEEENKHLSNVSDYETISLECVHLEEQLEIANSRIQELEKEKVELKEYNKTVSDRIVEYKKNSIPTQVVTDLIQEYKDKIERYDEYRIQGKETDVEYYENIANTIIVQVLQELLEGEK